MNYPVIFLVGFVLLVLIGVIASIYQNQIYGIEKMTKVNLDGFLFEEVEASGTLVLVVDKDINIVISKLIEYQGWYKCANDNVVAYGKSDLEAFRKFRNKLPSTLNNIERLNSFFKE